MHTHHSTNGTTFNYNSDLSGEVIVTVDYHQIIGSGGPKMHVHIPAEDLLEFVAYSYVLSKRVEELEGMDYRQLLEGWSNGAT